MANNGPSFFGTGTYQPPSYNIDPNAFNNPGYTPGQLGTQLNNYLPATTAPVQAQTSAPVYNPNVGIGTQGQLGIANLYQQQAAGNGPSLANTQAQQQGASNLAQTQALLGSARGSGNPAAAQLASAQAGANGQQQIAQNAILGRTQEETNALSQAGGLYGNVANQGLTATGQQIGQNQFNAGQANQIGVSNQANTLAANNAYLQALQTIAAQQQQGSIQGQQLGVQQQLGIGNIGVQAYNNAAKNQQTALGLGFQGIGSIANAASGLGAII